MSKLKFSCRVSNGKTKVLQCKILQSLSITYSSFNVQIYTSMESFQSPTSSYNCSKRERNLDNRSFLLENLMPK